MKNAVNSVFLPRDPLQSAVMLYVVTSVCLSVCMSVSVTVYVDHVVLMFLDNNHRH